MKTINFLSLLLGILLLPGQISAQLNAVPEVTPNDVAGLLANDALFVDVRESNEVEVLAYDLPGVINMPLSELPGRLAELPKDRPVILACRSGKRSLKAAALLTENNFTQLFNLTGGIIAWEAAELPVKTTERTEVLSTMSNKQCCSASGAGKGAGKSCCAKTPNAETTEKASCGGKGKGKACCGGK